jgi:hypothetical protein
MPTAGVSLAVGGVSDCHQAQAIRGEPGDFKMFNYGRDCGTWRRQGTCNQQKYGGSTSPPYYQLSHVPEDIRIAMFVVSE